MPCFIAQFRSAIVFLQEKENKAKKKSKIKSTMNATNVYFNITLVILTSIYIIYRNVEIFAHKNSNK
jgi:hypothetical protein